MCGIIGYTGNADALPKMTTGLSVLEYRGYDSVGIAAETENGTRVVKCKGRVGALEALLKAGDPIVTTCGIGHTRWATHGGPSDRNAHPHRQGSAVVVHNGIIENYQAIKQKFIQNGVEFVSDTDTEVAAALFHHYMAHKGDPISAIIMATEQMTGSYAFGILFDSHPGEIYAVRCGSPLILARGEDGYYLASDITALLPFTKEYHCLEEGQIARLTKTGATLYSADGSAAIPQWSISDLTSEAAQKGGYEHFMLKEICEQPEALVKSVSCRITKGLPDLSADGITEALLQGIKQIQIVACGSAMHAGIVGSKLLEQIAKVPTTVHIASEYRYDPPLCGKDTLVLAISQSGETADTLAALRDAKGRGLLTMAIVNAVATSIAREADRCIYTYAGPEIAVATTKGYCTQVSVLYLLALAIAGAKKIAGREKLAKMTEGLLLDAPRAVEQMLEKREAFEKIAEKIAQSEHIFYIGRGIDHAMSLEAALKLKEISYIHCEAYAAGELKHGTISLIEKGTPVIAISTDAALADKTASNTREVASRGAETVLLCREDLKDPERIADEVLRLPVKSEASTLFAAMTAVQLLAYETARLRGCDIDRPRNLAKSVTVE